MDVEGRTGGGRTARGEDSRDSRLGRQTRDDAARKTADGTTTHWHSTAPSAIGLRRTPRSRLRNRKARRTDRRGDVSTVEFIDDDDIREEGDADAGRLAVPWQVKLLAALWREI